MVYTKIQKYFSRDFQGYFDNFQGAYSNRFSHSEELEVRARRDPRLNQYCKSGFLERDIRGRCMTRKKGALAYP